MKIIEYKTKSQQRFLYSGHKKTMDWFWNYFQLARRTSSPDLTLTNFYEKDLTPSIRKKIKREKWDFVPNRMITYITDSCD